MKREAQEEFYKIDNMTPLAIIEERVELKYKTLIEKLEQKLAISKENEKATTILYAIQHPHGEIKYLKPKDELTQQLWDQRELEEKLKEIKTVEERCEKLIIENQRLHEKIQEEKERRDEIVGAKIRLLLEDKDRVFDAMVLSMKETINNKERIIEENQTLIDELSKKPPTFLETIKEKWNNFILFMKEWDKED